MRLCHVIPPTHLWTRQTYQPTDRPTNVYISREISIEHPSVGARFARPINCIILIKAFSLVKVIRTIHNIYVCMYINIVLIYVTVPGKRDQVAHFFKIELLLPQGRIGF